MKYRKLKTLNKYFSHSKTKWNNNKMTNPKGMDELFWGKDLEDMLD
jgi:hypothetical protein